MLDQTQSEFDEISSTKDLFANCQATADNYISPKTICELIKAGNWDKICLTYVHII